MGARARVGTSGLETALLGAARPAARGGRRHEQPDKGRPPAPGRVDAPPSRPTAGPHRALAEVACAEPRCPRPRLGSSGPLRPRPPPLPHLPAAGDMFRPRRPRLPTPPRGPPRAADPSATALRLGTPRSARVRPRKTAEPRGARGPGLGTARETHDPTAKGRGRDYLSARTRTRVGVVTVTPAGRTVRWKDKAERR